LTPQAPSSILLNTTRGSYHVTQGPRRIVCSTNSSQATIISI
jgi:hypothetical protein